MITTTNNTTVISDKKKSAVLSILVFFCLIVLLHFLRFWPPSNLTELVNAEGGGGGVTVNFGDTDFGSNANFLNKNPEQKQTEIAIKKEASAADELLTSQNSTTDITVVKSANKQKEKLMSPIKYEIKPTETKKPIVKKVDDALANLLKGNSKAGDGTTNNTGNQGRANGNLNSGNYSNKGSGGGVGNGNGIGSGQGDGSGSGKGSGSGSGYALGNRKALSKPTPNYTCNEEGKVVVEISVNRSGQVISAKAGVQGTTNTAGCLLSQAKIAALNTKWEPSNDAPDIQIGKIIYNFSLN